MNAVVTGSLKLERRGCATCPDFKSILLLAQTRIDSWTLTPISTGESGSAIWRATGNLIHLREVRGAIPWFHQSNISYQQMSVFTRTHGDIDNAMVLHFISADKIQQRNKSKTHHEEGKSGEHGSLLSYSKYENQGPSSLPGHTNLRAKRGTKKDVNLGPWIMQKERHAHLGTRAREDGGHLPIELLGAPEAAGLVEKGVDLRDRAPVPRRD